MQKIKNDAFFGFTLRWKKYNIGNLVASALGIMDCPCKMEKGQGRCGLVLAPFRHTTLLLSGACSYKTVVPARPGQYPPVLLETTIGCNGWFWCLRCAVPNCPGQPGYCDNKPMPQTTLKALNSPEVPCGYWCEWKHWRNMRLTKQIQQTRYSGVWVCICGFNGVHRFSWFQTAGGWFATLDFQGREHEAWPILLR